MKSHIFTFGEDFIQTIDRNEFIQILKTEIKETKHRIAKADYLIDYGMMRFKRLNIREKDVVNIHSIEDCWTHMKLDQKVALLYFDEFLEIVDDLDDKKISKLICKHCDAKETYYERISKIMNEFYVSIANDNTTVCINDEQCLNYMDFDEENSRFIKLMNKEILNINAFVDDLYYGTTQVTIEVPHQYRDLYANSKSEVAIRVIDNVIEAESVPDIHNISLKILNQNEEVVYEDIVSQKDLKHTYELVLEKGTYQLKINTPESDYLNIVDEIEVKKDGEGDNGFEYVFSFDEIQAK